LELLIDSATALKKPSGAAPPNRATPIFRLSCANSATIRPPPNENICERRAPNAAYFA
jgi:hypothetical protein